jgi:ATP-dependent DNA helicase RecG
VVGTHALMQEGVAFRDLALAIVDEQHRFGVHQR